MQARLRKSGKRKSLTIPKSDPGIRAVDQSLKDTVFWTGIYKFHSSGDPGVTGSVSWIDQTGKITVVAFDILLQGLINKIASIKITENGHTFLFNNTGNVINALPSKQYMAVESVVADWVQLGFKSDEPDKIVIDGETWWVDFRPIRVANPKNFIGFIIPERDFPGDIRDKRMLLAFIIIIIILLSVLSAVFLVRKYGKKMKIISSSKLNQDDIKNDILSRIEVGEGPNIEFKSTMRMNLKAGRPGKEIELAWLKTVAAFLNSAGGILFIGVNDGGKITGIEPDEFESDDRCQLHFKNVFSQHIGSEFAQYVHCEIHEISGKKMVSVECDQSKAPVFVHSKNDEESFYIRSGPSSVKLSMSKVLKYINQRQG